MSRKRPVLNIIIILLLSVILLLGYAIYANRTQPSNIGINPETNNLYPCPWTPNCISSNNGGYDANFGPIRIPDEMSATEAMKRIERVLLSQEEYAIKKISSFGPYMHFVSTTRQLGFKDDIEFIVVTDTNDQTPINIIHYRSASRIGYSDNGLNKRRMDFLIPLITEEFAK